MKAPGNGAFIPLWHEEREWLARLAPGDPVERRSVMDGPAVTLRVTRRTRDRIICDHHEFDPETGAEIHGERSGETEAGGSCIRPPGN
jgi:hypothetical protein